MSSIRTTALGFIVFALLIVQYGSLLHAAVHPFHVDQSEHAAGHKQEHTSEQTAHLHLNGDDAHDDHDHHHHEQSHHDADTGINCDVFFAGERLAHAVLLIPPTTSLKTSNTKHAVVQGQSAQQRHTLRPRSRSPPVLLT